MVRRRRQLSQRRAARDGALHAVNADTIDYTAVITDPKVYTRPWTMALTFDRFKDYGSELYEEACFETNERTLEHDADEARALFLYQAGYGTMALLRSIDVSPPTMSVGA